MIGILYAFLETLFFLTKSKVTVYDSGVKKIRYEEDYI